MYVIGDVHGKIDMYLKLVKSLDGPSIQVGDMGIGFRDVHLPTLENHKFFRGNHDNPSRCREHTNYYREYGYDEKTGIFNMAGAWSIDWKYRVEGASWWADEELDWASLQQAADLYLEVKPRYVLTHDCPSSVVPYLLAPVLIPGDTSNSYFNAKLECKNSRTTQVLQSMFERWQPQRWIFGHYHFDRIFDMQGTNFQCLAELSHTKLEVQ